MSVGGKRRVVRRYRQGDLNSAIKGVGAGLMLALTLAGLSTLSSPPAGAVPSFHEWASGAITASSSYTGLEQTRYDHQMKFPGSKTCDVFHKGGTVYADQGQWIITGSGPGGLDWIEMGTLWQCQTYEFWYGIHGVTAYTHVLWTATTASRTDHSFFLYANTTHGQHVYHFNVSGTNFYTYPSTAKGLEEQAGLESFDATLSVLYHTNNLSYQTGYNQTWSKWSRDVTDSTGSPMCYTKTPSSGAIIYVGEHTTC